MQSQRSKEIVLLSDIGIMKPGIHTMPVSKRTLTVKGTTKAFNSGTETVDCETKTAGFET
jgi:hypothetical protein